MNTPVTLYDTTLRDGTQGEGINLSLGDKLRIAERLDQFGVDYIEGGWPGSNEKDIEFFRAAANKTWKHARIAAFGSTRRVGVLAKEDAQVQLLLDSLAPVVTIFGKTWLLHVSEVLKTTPEENLAMIRDTVQVLCGAGREVVYDAEHFFDGYKDNPEYAIKCLLAAQEGGAGHVILCDTNGGTLPNEVAKICADVREKIRVKFGIHTHNDGGLAVANAIAAVEKGAEQVQGTINGYGERTGNCNLVTMIPNLQLKMGRPVVSQESLSGLRDLSLFLDEVANQRHDTRAPFVGESSFAHKGGMHVNAVNKLAKTFEHIDPATVGNHRRILVGELSGRTNVFMKAREMGIALDEKDPDTREILQRIKSMEAKGYEFEAADASFALLIRRIREKTEPAFYLQEYHVSMRNSPVRQYQEAEATVKILVGGEPFYTVAGGDGPVNALDNAMRKALATAYPQIQNIRLTDYKVRILDSNRGTEAKTRVLITSADGAKEWSTVGVSDNLVEASWLALADSIEYYLLDQKVSGN